VLDHLLALERHSNTGTGWLKLSTLFADVLQVPAKTRYRRQHL